MEPQLLALLVTVLIISGLVGLSLVFGRQRDRASISPVVVAQPEFVAARTSPVAKFLTLGLSIRRVVVDGHNQKVYINARRLWFFNREREIAFSEIEKIVYRFTDLNPITALGMTGDGFESFVIKLRLHGGDVVHLFSFIGDGDFQTGWDTPSWLKGTHWFERMTDTRGRQQEDSKALIDRIHAILKVDITSRDFY